MGKILNQQKHSLLGISILFTACVLFLLNDLFLLKLDESIGEILVCKILGIISILIYIKVNHMLFTDIGIYKKGVQKSIGFGLIIAAISMTTCYLSEFLYIYFNEGSPYFAYNTSYNVIGLIVFVIIGNIINAIMEEGLFRGVIFMRLLKKHPYIYANAIQAIIFGLWHVPLVYKDYVIGRIDFQGMISQSILYTIIAALMGFLMGAIFHKTGNLLSNITWHMLWNASQNVLLIKSNKLPEESDIMTNGYFVFWITFIIISLLLIVYFYRKSKNKSISYNI